MSVCRRGIDLLGTMNIGLNILQDIQSSFFRTFIHLPGRNRAIWHVIKVKHENSKYGNATIGNGLPALRCILSFCIDKVVGWVRNPDKKNHADIGAAIAAEHICLAVAVQGLGS